MICLDMQDNILTKDKILESEYRTGNKYIHQLKELTKDKDIVYFHIEVLDENGVMHICPGQLLRTPDVQQKDGVESVLKEILEEFTVIII